MLAVHAMSAGAQAVFFFIALVAFVVAALVNWFATKGVWATLVALGLALGTFVFFWNALALS